MQTREYPHVPDELVQLVLTGFPAPGTTRERHQVAETLARLRQLHDELNARLRAHPAQRPRIQSPQEAYAILTCFLGNLDHEELWVLNLDTRNQLLHLVKLYQGSVNSSQVRVGEVFRAALIDNAAGILIAHNHPSGDTSPSPEDVHVTRAIVEAGKLLDVDVLDHLIITRDRFVSFRERSLGF